MSPDNAITGIDVDQHTIAFWIYVDATPVAGQSIYTECTANGAGTGRLFVYVVAPTVAGFKILVLAKWTTDGRWAGDDISLNAWHHVMVTYDRAATTNDPEIVVDGVSQTVAEQLTPTGTVQSGQDTVKMGENPGGGEDANCAVAFTAGRGGALWTAAADGNQHRWWGRVAGSQVCLPLISTKLDNDGTIATTFAATGTTVIATPVPVVRPGSAMMGMGVGW